MKKILVTGSQSYIGSVLTPYLIEAGYDCVGIDSGLIKDCTLFLASDVRTIYKDVREVTKKDLKGFDTVVHLAGISNDPFRNFDPVKVYDPVRAYTLKIAQLCKGLGIKFIFSSSCSVYGKGVNGFLDEQSQVFPQTPYSLNKLQIENDLKKLGDGSFTPIIFRFATAFGLSPRIRFDLVVNMLTGMAYTTGKIILNSNGQAWRPFVHLSDICKAIKFAIDFTPKKGNTIILNVGSSSENYQIIEVAKIVKKAVPGCKIEFINQGSTAINKELIKDRKIQDGVDSRNYKISFEKIKRIFPGFESDFTLQKGVIQMLKKFKEIKLSKSDFENINFYRLQKLESLIKEGLVTEQLSWVKKPDFNEDPPIDLSTKRLHLRLFKVSDISKKYIKALNSPEIIGLTESRYRSWSEAEVKEYVNKKGNLKGESLLIGIFIKGKEERHIGNIRLHSFSEINRRVELGILIWDKKEWGKNYGTESLEVLVDLIFNNLNLHKICAEYYSVNKGSGKMFKKLGFKVEGILKQHFLVNNKFVDAVRVAKYNPSQE